MLAYDELKQRKGYYQELKKVCASVNLKGILEENIQHNGVKGAQIYDNFVKAIDGLSDDVKPDLPDDVIDYYNMIQEFSEAIVDPDAEPEPDSLNFEIVENREEFDAPASEHGDEEESDSTPDPVVKAKAQPKSEPVTDTQEGEKAELEIAPIKKIMRLSTTPMTPKVEDSKLTINFKELDVTEVFDLPATDDKEKLGVVRKKAMAFAKENGATKGQLCNISKTLNIAGYYMR